MRVSSASHPCVVVVVLLLLSAWSPTRGSRVVLSVSALRMPAAPPPLSSLLGIGAVLFPVPNQIVAVSTMDWKDKYDALQEASDFFVEAFWTNKVGGGARTLSAQQYADLRQSQTAEFNRRYGQSSRSKKNELFICRRRRRSNQGVRSAAAAAGGPILATVGVEVDGIPRSSLWGSKDIRAPLMSNLAVLSSVRRRGLAEALVAAVEDMCVNWGYHSCYLYVEERNRGAIRLYQKLGYQILWKDDTATTLLPSKFGDLRDSETTLVCMRKDGLSSNKKLDNLFKRFGQ